jgi:hypothetical protein
VSIRVVVEITQLIFVMACRVAISSSFTMQLFKKEQRFDPKTGMPLGNKLVPSVQICDFCGEEIPDYDPDDMHLVYEITDPSESEPFFHELRCEKHEKVDMYSVYNNHRKFVFCCRVDGKNCEAEMLLMKKKHRNFSIGILMFMARLDVIDALLDAGKTLEELNLEEET